MFKGCHFPSEVIHVLVNTEGSFLSCLFGSEALILKVRKLKVSLPLKERAKSKVIQLVVIGLW